MRKIIAKILNAKTMFGTECSSFRLIIRADRNNGYTALYNIMLLVYPLLMDESVEFHIPYQKKIISFPDNVDNIMNYI